MEIRKLQFLQTLDLQWTNSKELPSSVAQLRHLMCLILDLGMPLPNGFSNLTCLEQLTGHGEGIFTADNAKELGCLIKLRELAFIWNGWSRPDDLTTVKALFESLSNMQKFESLEISDVDSWVFQLMLKLDWVPPPNLRRLKLVGVFWNLPTWICSSLLPLLSHLDLTTNRKVQSGDIQILGMLPALQYVTLRVGGLNVHDLLENLVISAGAFPSLRVCLFQNILLMPPTFQPGAMPMVQRLRFGLRVSDVLSPDFDLSIRNLPSLKQLRIDLFNNGAGPGDYSQAVDMLRHLADDHPKNPTLRADKFIRERLSRVEPSDEQNHASSR
uniref:Disease resistance R13L4/SHOC-2-like LRR domain-containing protein n=1 Tax=Aegilops tauschii subsp. strangulata TaxID=200361 RepID=A0A453DL31_AEGTS